MEVHPTAQTTHNAHIVNPRVIDRIVAVQSTAEDAPAIMDLLLKTAQWLNSKGSTQWGALLHGEDAHHSVESARRGDVYLFKDGDTLAGIVMLLRSPSPWDIELWGEEGHEGAVYLHRLAINRDYSGRNLGEAILQWVHTGIRFDGKDRIRLDCNDSNPLLDQFYRSAGYTYMGHADKGFFLFERMQPTLQ
ncbi:acetyltransferase (GNAT) family protein [Paenibacillus cellulosilyticus]|uniref:Acetyltransferase (GNAT) family protein n=1 Tax=Paenibacillus cellulosilyticus TaxID=375489 RepID=A0A2V2YQ76_9BACL|nr:GNAT family N-acetyltransferase [Paenibacillus cellulosilyticus]PWV95206.1 acetyltransferase (GNAT) family protein [Paenibacillus cellulosilyticus]QKS46044.1 GNAT family N-acetyltransferase [Paenibacillus cellulosilyticus]